MRRILNCVLAAVIAVPLFALSAAAESENLLINPGFEDELLGEGYWHFANPGGWYTETDLTAETTAEYAKSGSRSMALKHVSVAQRIALKRGASYTMSLWAKAEPDCKLYISVCDGASEWPASNHLSEYEADASGEWTRFTYSFEADEEKDYVITLANWENAMVYIDDIEFREDDMYISSLDIGADENGEISFKAGYTAPDDAVFAVVLYDEDNNVRGCIANSLTGTFEALPSYGIRTVKAYLWDENESRTKTAQLTYEGTKVNSVGKARTLALSEHDMELYVGGEGVLDAIVMPDYAYNKSVVWTSSNEAVASVSDNGIITPVSEGSTVISASADGGKLTDSCNVTVISSPSADKITLSSTSLTLPEKGAMAYLTAAGGQKVIWESSDENVAVVNDGAVTSVNPGRAEITAKADGKTAKCSVTVEKVKGLITNDEFYTDTDGNPIYANGGGIYRYGDRYYLYGCKYKEMPVYAEHPENGIAGNAQFEAFTCYSSEDLVNWKFEGYPMTKDTDGINPGWVGRMGVAYNSNTKKYVLVAQAVPGMLFATSDTPEGPFEVYKFYTDLDGVLVNGGTGDQSIFVDEDGQAYLICASMNGREHLYVVPLREKDFLDLDRERVHEIYFDETSEYIDEDGNVQVKGKKGIEGDCMFRYGDTYYFSGSDLYGWNGSRAYYFRADDILGDYNSETKLPNMMAGVRDNFSHTSQTGFYYTIHGREQDLVMYCGDRWSAFAGNGLGFNIWEPLSFDEDGTPHFNNLHQWILDSEKGTWEVGAANNYINNPDFEADRIEVTAPAGWTVYDTVGGHANRNLSGKQYAGNFVWEQKADEAYAAELKQEISGLPDGTYALKAWVRSSGGQNICRLYANEKSVSLKKQTEQWEEIVVPDIEVSGGICTIRLYSDAPANVWVQIDNLGLIKLSV